MRSQVGFLTLCRTPELAAQVTLQPVDILGVDAAVIFSDILLLLDAMGLTVQFEYEHGPHIGEPIRSPDDVSRLHGPNIDRDLRPTLEAIRLTVWALADRGVPVIGFAGAPFTLACYAIDGKTERDFHRTKRFMNENPSGFAKILEKLADGISLYLRAQIEAGAAAVQLFDSWGGILGQEAYRAIVLPSLHRVISPLKSLGAPVILYLNGSSPHLETMAESGADVLSVDWRLPFSKVRKRVGDKAALQGNLDPSVLHAPADRIVQATRDMLAEHPGPGLIANLGHGILPDTSVEGAKTFVNTVRGFK